MKDEQMNKTSKDTALLLPIETLLLLGAGSQGAAAILSFRLAVDDFDSEFAAVVEDFEASDDVEAPAKLAISRTIVDLSRQARSWLSIRSDDDRVAPGILLIGENFALGAIVHRDVVEYLVGGHDLVARVVRGAIGASQDAGVDATVFDGDIALAGARFKNGAVDLAAKAPDRLDRLASAASHGLESLLDDLVS